MAALFSRAASSALGDVTHALSKQLHSKPDILDELGSNLDPTHLRAKIISLINPDGKDTRLKADMDALGDKHLKTLFEHRMDLRDNYENKLQNFERYDHIVQDPVTNVSKYLEEGLKGWKVLIVVLSLIWIVLLIVGKDEAARVMGAALYYIVALFIIYLSAMILYKLRKAFTTPNLPRSVIGVRIWEGRIIVVGSVFVILTTFFVLIPPLRKHIEWLF